MQYTLELAAVGDDVERARAVARALDGRAFLDERPDARDLPFRAMVLAVTDDLEALRPAAAVGAYVVCRRTIKPRRHSVRGAAGDPHASSDAGAPGGPGVAGAVAPGVPGSGPAALSAAPPIRLPGVIGLFPMVRHPALTHRDADRHWRDVHAPLALVHHAAMSHYTQLSVVERLDGPEWDGFALCGFDSLEDLRERFFATPEGRIAIREDVARFADVERSPRRLIVVEEEFPAPRL